MAAPPVAAGGVKAMLAWALPGVATRPVGASGAVSWLMRTLALAPVLSTSTTRPSASLIELPAGIPTVGVSSSQ